MFGSRNPRPSEQEERGIRLTQDFDRDNLGHQSRMGGKHLYRQRRTQRVGLLYNRGALVVVGTSQLFSPKSLVGLQLNPQAPPTAGSPPRPLENRRAHGQLQLLGSNSM